MPARDKAWSLRGAAVARVQESAGEGAEELPDKTLQYRGRKYCGGKICEGGLLSVTGATKGFVDAQ